MKGITLIGMPGAGKSTVGKLLAEKLGYKFVDLDVLIKEKENKSHADILEKDGEARLLKLEKDYTLALSLEKTVFSPGGSIIYSPQAMEKLKKETLIVFLDMPLGKIRERLGGGIKKRGIVGLEKGLENLFWERTPIYKSYADRTIDCSNLSDQSIANVILQHQQKI